MIVIDSNNTISNYMYDRLNELNIDVIKLNEEIINLYKNNEDVLLVSNILNEEDKVEIIYALRNKDTLAKLINDKLEEKNIQVDKYYQKRSEKDTSKDYYDIQKNTGNIETIVIKYNKDSLNNYKEYTEAIIEGIITYKGLDNIYVVKKGDTLYSISRKYNIKVDELKRMNNLSSNIIYIGQVLKINKNIYTVKKGDTLYSIAKRYNTTVENIKKLNNLSSNLLSIGQQLKISN